MTICIAAIGKCIEFNKNEEAIVFATDHMITLQQIGQFEHSIEKYRKINQNTIAMLSGEALLFDDVLKGMDEKQNFDEIKGKIHNNMVGIRDEKVKKMILDRFKIDFDYLKQLLNNPEHNDIAQEILETIKQFNLNTSVILAGFIGGKAQIAEINELAAINTRDINFDAIGSGGTQAINTLLFQKHSKSDDLKTTLFNVYKAKRNSEVSVGVGKETDIFILTEEQIYFIDGLQKLLLEKIYNDEMKVGKTHKDLNMIISNLKGVENV